MGAYEYQGGSVVRSVPTSLFFAQQPSSAVTGAAITPPIVVDIDNQNGNVLSGDDADVTISVASGPSSALNGTVTIAAINGVATLSNLALNTAGTYTLTATDSTDNLMASSNPFVVSPQTGGTSFATLNGGLLSVIGTSGNDTITVASSGTGITATLNGETSEPFPASQIVSIDVSGLAGNDKITIGANIIGASVKGGGGADTLKGGDGNDTLVGGAGDNIVHCGNGNDSVSSGISSADTIMGGAGQDTLRDSGSLAGESFTHIAQCISPTELASDLEINGVPYFVSIERTQSSDNTINNSIPTWLVIHGLISSPSAMAHIDRAISKTESGDQVLTLDWSLVADQYIDVNLGKFDYPNIFPNPFPVEDAVPAVGKWAEAAMALAGFDLSKLNIVGHSYGAYVGEEIAMNAPAGINTIIALDPGQDVNDPPIFSALKKRAKADDSTIGIQYAAKLNQAQQAAPMPFSVNLNINFSANTKNSWAFYGEDSFGDAATAATAKQAFAINELGNSDGPILYGYTFLIVPSQSAPSQANAHENIINIFANILLGTGPIGELFSLGNLLDGDDGPWEPDQFEAGPPTEALLPPIEPPVQLFNAVLTTTFDGTDLAKMVYIDKTTDAKVKLPL